MSPWVGDPRSALLGRFGHHTYHVVNTPPGDMLQAFGAALTNALTITEIVIVASTAGPSAPAGLWRRLVTASPACDTACESLPRVVHNARCMLAESGHVDRGLGEHVCPVVCRRDETNVDLARRYGVRERKLQPRIY